MNFYIVDKNYIRYLKQFDSHVEDVNYGSKIRPHLVNLQKNLENYKNLWKLQKFLEAVTQFLEITKFLGRYYKKFLEISALYSIIKLKIDLIGFL